MRQLFSGFIPGAAKTKGSMKHVGSGHMVEGVEGSKDWRRLMAGVFKGKLTEPWAGACSVTATFYLRPPRTRKTLADQRAWLVAEGSGDTDKLLRNLYDAAQDSKLIVNDSQFTMAIVEKKLISTDVQVPGVMVQIWALFDE